MTTADPDQAERSRRFGPAAVATVTISLVSWRIAFNLGAYGEVFYDDVLAFVVASTVGLAISVVASPYARDRQLFTSVALAAPAVWFVLAVLLFDSTAAAASRPVFGFIGLAIVLVSVPVGVKLLVDLFAPDLVSVRERGLFAYGLAIIVIVAAVGYVVGANNDAFLTCDDFKVAGADQPSNCAPG